MPVCGKNLTNIQLQGFEMFFHRQHQSFFSCSITLGQVLASVGEQVQGDRYQQGKKYEAFTFKRIISMILNHLSLKVLCYMFFYVQIL